MQPTRSKRRSDASARIALLTLTPLLLVFGPSALRAQTVAHGTSPVTVFITGTGGFGGGTGANAGTAGLAAVSLEVGTPKLAWLFGLEGQRDYTQTRVAATGSGGTGAAYVDHTSSALFVWLHHDWRSEFNWTPFLGAGLGVTGLSSTQVTTRGSFGVDGGVQYQPGPVGLRIAGRAQLGHTALVFITLALRVRLGPALRGAMPPL